MYNGINLNPANFIIASGVLQCFIISIILFFRKADQVLPYRLLAVIILLVSLHLTYLIILDLNLDNRYPYLLWFPYSYLNAIGPLVLLYTKSLTKSDFKITRKEIIYFFPLLIEVGLQVIQIAVSIYSNKLYYNTPFDFAFTVVIYISATISFFYFLKQTLTYLNTYEIGLENKFSNLKGRTMSWLHRSLTYYRLVWLLWMPFALVFLLLFRFQWQYLSLVIIAYFLMLSITYLTYWIGLQGFRNLAFFQYQDTPKVKSRSYAYLSDSDIENYILKMERLMQEDKTYLNENLDLRAFANELSVEPNLVSHVLNNHLHKTFFKYINDYRVEEVKRRMGDPVFSHLTILAIAFESGFNSKTSFNRIFKQMTGMTPTQYQKYSSK